MAVWRVGSIGKNADANVNADEMQIDDDFRHKSFLLLVDIL
jgi:hypothetical protein